MNRSGLADSPLFPKNLNSPQKTIQKIPILPKHESNSKPTLKPLHLDTLQPRYLATWIESIRKAVKEIGKEAATYRFTQAEKRSLLETVYSFNLKGNKTTENEITRIAVNFILQDFKTNKKESILNRVIESLRQ